MFGCLNFFKIRSSFASAFRRLGVCRVPCAVRCMGFVAASELQPRPLCQHTVDVVSAYRECCVSIPWMAQSAILRNGTDARCSAHLWEEHQNSFLDEHYAMPVGRVFWFLFRNFVFGGVFVLPTLPLLLWMLRFCSGRSALALPQSMSHLLCSSTERHRRTPLSLSGKALATAAVPGCHPHACCHSCCCFCCRCSHFHGASLLARVA